MEKKKGVLYLGFDPRHYKTTKPIIHMPLVEIEPRPIDSVEIKRIFSDIPHYTHLIFSSKNSVKLFIQTLKHFGYTISLLKKAHIIAIGQMTAFYLLEANLPPTYIASDETQEGIIKTLAHLDLDKANVLLPRSSAARPLLSHYLVEQGIRHQICTLYDMKKKRPYKIVDLDEVDEVLFTTPIAVDSFFDLYRVIPQHLKLHPIGPSARERLRKILHEKTKAVQATLPKKTTALAC